MLIILRTIRTIILPSSINTISIVSRGETWIICRHSQNNGVSAQLLERLSRVQIESSRVFSGCDNIGYEGYLKDMPLICDILVVPFSKPEIFLDMW